MTDLAITTRTRERANRILGQNASNSAKALAKDALELCELVEEFRAELPQPSANRIRRMLRVRNAA